MLGNAEESPKLQNPLTAQCKVMRARETSGRLHKGPKATYKVLPSTGQAGFLASAALHLHWGSGVCGQVPPNGQS